MSILGHRPEGACCFTRNPFELQTLDAYLEVLYEKIKVWHYVKCRMLETQDQADYFLEFLSTRESEFIWLGKGIFAFVRAEDAIQMKLALG
jgi:hypothetical protein